MNRFITEIADTDKKLSDYYIKKHKKSLDRFIQLIAINPVIFYVFFFFVNYSYFQNKYLLLFLSFIIVNIILVIIKQFIKRVRPIPRKGNLIHELLDFQPDNYSFPSVHSFSMFLLIPLSFVLFGNLGLVLLIYAFFIAFTRIYLGYHYLSDVIVGILLGIICGSLLLNLYLSYF